MSIHGPGILFVRSRIAPSAKGILDENTFLRWYDNEHIAEVVETSGISFAFRYIDPNTPSAYGDQTNPKPFLVFYPLHDLSFTQSEEFHKISIRSDNLPGNGVVYDLADFDVSYLGLSSRGEESVNYHVAADHIITFGIRPANDNTLSSSVINSLFQQQNQILSPCVGYIRTFTFELQYARTNAQSRKLKGLPTVDEPFSNPPTHLAIHEFTSVPDPKVLQALFRTVQGIDVEVEAITWKLARAHRKGNIVP